VTTLQRNFLAAASVLVLSLYAPLVRAQSDAPDAVFDDPANNDSAETGNEDSDFSPDVRMGTPTMQGSGCRPADSSIVLAPDNKSLSFLFGGYQAAAGAGTPMAQRGCKIRIPFKVPPGFRAVVVKVDYRGFNSLPVNSTNVYRAEYSLLRPKDLVPLTPTIVRRREFSGPLSSDFRISSRIRRMRDWSQCGQDFVLAIDTLARSLANKRLQDTLASLDSADVAARGQGGSPMAFHLRWKRCR
jgi:hypothetical protein